MRFSIDNLPGVMNESTKPQSRKDIVAKQLGNEMMLYDPRSDNVHVLNETSLFIWKLLDGKHSHKDIEVKIREQFEAPSDQNVLQDVTKICADFRDKGLLE